MVLTAEFQPANKGRTALQAWQQNLLKPFNELCVVFLLQFGQNNNLVVIINYLLNVIRIIN